MLTVEQPTAVGNFGFGFVYVVYIEGWGGYTEYWDYFYSQQEAQDLVDRIYWKELKIEVYPESLWTFYKDKLTFIHRGYM